MAVWILYNPLAGQNCRDTAEALEVVIDEEVTLYDITKVTNYAAFLSELTAEDRLVIVGGDGTLHRFVNDTAHLTLLPQVCYYPCGTGNDLARDLGATEPAMPFPVGDCLRGLPEVEMKGQRRLFLNAVGFGVDGYCCLQSDALRARGKRRTMRPSPWAACWAVFVLSAPWSPWTVCPIVSGRCGWPRCSTGGITAAV